MDIKLLQLYLKNFKGVKEYRFAPNGANAEINGDNATGKTTLIDGFFFLLFGKDSQGKADFEIKTLQPDGNQIHNLDHEVEGVFLIDEKPLSLKKVFSEVWTKKRGTTTPAFTGHTTKYYVDDVPVKEKEYKAKIESLIDENIFRLLTDPRHLNSINWKDRRDIILTVCGDVSDDDVIQSANLDGLKDILGDHSIDDQKKIINEKRKKINDGLKEIPARIDELKSTLPAPADLSALNHELANVQQEKTFLQEEKRRLEESDGQAQLKADIATKKAELQTIKTNHQTNIREMKSDHEARLSEKEKALSALERKKTEAEQNRDAAQVKRNAKNKEVESKLAEWMKEDGQEFDYDDETTCSRCGQSLPPDQIEKARQTALETFNKTKAAALDRIDKEGVELKAEAARFDQMAAKFITDIEQAKADIETIKTEIAGIKDQIKEVESTPMPDSYATTEKEIKYLESRLESQEKPDTTELDQQIQERTDRETEINNQIAAENQRAKSDARINELESQEKKLAAEYEKLEGHLNMIDAFVIAKVNLLEEKINSRFMITKFKLFDRQINGGVNEMCVATFNGVPYPSMNNAAKINVGLDIINALSEHHDFTAPIWIDNAEAVTSYIDTRAQVIRLNVSAGHKELTVIQDEKNENAA